MNALKIFLQALERALQGSGKFFVPRFTSVDTPVNTIKTCRIVVTCMDNGNKTVIADVKNNFNISVMQLDDIKDTLTKQVIVEILKYYGI